MFQNNLSALELKNKSLADKISKIKIEDIKDIAVVQAQNGDYILAYQNTALHDIKDPMREAKSIWFRTVKKELKSNDIQVVFGLGLGYLFKRAYVSAPSKIFLFEPSLEILRYVLEYVDFSKEILDNRVFIFNEEKEILSRLKSDFLIGDSLEIVYLPAYAMFYKELLIDLSQKLFEEVKSKTIDINTINMNNVENSVKNLLSHMDNFFDIRSVDCFENLFEGKTALILSAGPSLNDDIEKIKQNRELFVIFAVPSILKYALKKGIKPDFMLAADTNRVYEQYRDCLEDIKDINILFTSRAQHCLSTDGFKTNLCYFPKTDTILCAIVNNAGIDEIKMHPSPQSVSVLAYQAAKIMGFSNIVYSGLDLAILNGQLYAYDCNFEFLSDSAIRIHYNSKDSYDFPICKVKSADNSEVFAREDYRLFIKQFEDFLSSQKDSPKVFSTALHGALVNGLTYLSMDEILSKLSKQKVNVSNLIEKKFSESSKKWNEFSTKSYAYLASQKQELDLIYQKAVYLSEKSKELIDYSNDNNLDLTFLQSKYDEVKEDFARLRTEIMNNVFLSAYIQLDLLEYIQKYKNEYLQDVDIFRNNITLESQLCAKIINKYGDLKSSMESVLNNHYEKTS